MIFRKQQDYDSFRCIADKCPKSCCIGWQIMIDENSLAKYKGISGTFADRIRSGVDYEASAFRQRNTRCNMLNATGLCDLQSTLGESYLCDTCRLYPRHIEEFQDLREYSLSLSCPEVVNMLLSPGYTFGITESEDETTDDPEEFEDFDFFLFDQLEYAREQMLSVASDHTLSLAERMSRIASAAYTLQTFYDEGDLLSMGAVAYDVVDTSCEGALGSYDYNLEALEVLADMEALESSWTELITEVITYWTAHDGSSPEYQSAIQPAEGPACSLENHFEQVFKSLLFTYFCGAVYDGQIYARAMIAIQSVRMMMLLFASGQLDLPSTIYLYSREVEHSDNNINALISHFEKELD